MANINVTATANAGPAIGELAALNAAIAAVQGKTVRVKVEVDGAAGVLAGLGQVAAAKAAASGNVNIGTGRARANVDGLGASARSMGQDMGRAGRDGSDGMARLGRSADTLRDKSDQAGTSTRRTRDSVSTLGNAAGAASGAFENLAGAGGKVASSLASLGPGGAAGPIGAAISGLLGVTQVAGYAAVGSGVLTGAVGALGVASAGAFGLVGAGAVAAGGAMGAFAVDALKDSKKFKGAFEDIGREAHLWSQFVAEPMGDAMVSMAAAASAAAPQIAVPLRGAFARVAAAAESGTDALLGTAVGAAMVAEQMAADVAPAIEAGLANLPRYAGAAAGAMQQLTREFGASAPAALDAAFPAFARAADAAGGLGAQLVRMGAANLAPFLDNMASMTEGATDMSRKLQPAVQPSMQAFTDLANAGMGAVGNLSPAIASFAGTVSANAAPLQSVMESIGGAGLSLGEGFVEGTARAAPALSSMRSAVEANQEPISDMVQGVWEVGAGIVEGVANTVGAKGLAEHMGVSGKGAWIPTAVGSGIQGFNESVDSGSWMDSVRGPLDKALGVTRGPEGGMTGMFSYGAPAPAPAVAPVAPVTAGGAALPQMIADLQRLQPAAQGAQSSMQGLGQVMTGGMLQAQQATGQAATGMRSSFQAGTQGMTQAAQGAQTAVPSTLQNMMGAATQRIQGAPIAGAMQQQAAQVPRAIQSAAPMAEAGGASLGAAATSGMGQGITKTETNTLTVIRKWIKKVIDEGMGALDASSPSRKFWRLGSYITSGLAGGINDTGGGSLGAIRGLVGRYQGEAQRVAPISAAGGPPSLLSGTPPPPSGPGEPAVDDRAGRRSAARGSANRMFGGPYPNRGLDAQGRWAPASPAEGAWFGHVARAERDLTGTGDAKRRAFGEDPNNPWGTHQVYDRFTAGWRAKPGMDITKAKSMDELSGMIESNVSPAQRKALGKTQGMLDSGDWAPISRARMEHTQQDIMRGKPYAFDVAGKLGKDPTTLPPGLAEEQAKTPGGGINPLNPYRAPGPGSSVGKSMDPAAFRALGAESGAALPQGMAQGARDNAPSARASITAMNEDLKKRHLGAWGISSPSRFTMRSGGDIVAGLAVGLGSNTSTATGAMTELSSAVQGVASDRGLQVGYAYARSIVDGTDQVLKKDLFQAVGAPRIESPQAKSVLGQLGLLGPAGSGASIWKSPMVTLGSSAPATQRPINLNLRVDLDGEPFRRMAVELDDQAMGELANMITLQAG